MDETDWSFQNAWVEEFQARGFEVEVTSNGRNDMGYRAESRILTK